MYKIFKNSIIVSLIVLATSYSCLQLSYTLFDISTRKVDAVANPDFGAKEKLFRNPVYLVSYADGHEVWFQNQHALAQSALNRGVDFTLNYRRSHLDEDFYKKNQAILDEKFGAGYWLWKPYVILKTMLMAPEGSIIIYADCGDIFTGSLMPILKYLKNHDGVFYRYDSDGNGSLNTTMDNQVAKELGVDEHPDFKIKSQLWAGFMVFRNCEATREFVKNWLELCTNPNFIKGYGKDKHFHDQSLMNIAFMKNSANFIALREQEFQTIVKWPHRGAVEAAYSLLPWQRSSMTFKEHVKWSTPRKWLRYVLFKGWC